MPTPIILPDLGAGPVSVSVWFAEVGDPVWEGERIVEVLTAGATFDVVAPASGRLTEKSAFPRESVTAGQVLGVVEGNRGNPDEKGGTVTSQG